MGPPFQGGLTGWKACPTRFFNRLLTHPRQASGLRGRVPNHPPCPRRQDAPCTCTAQTVTPVSRHGCIGGSTPGLSLLSSVTLWPSRQRGAVDRPGIISPTDLQTPHRTADKCAGARTPRRYQPSPWSRELGRLRYPSATGPTGSSAASPTDVGRSRQGTVRVPAGRLHREHQSSRRSQGASCCAVTGLAVLIAVFCLVAPRVGFDWGNVKEHLSEHRVALCACLLLAGLFVLCKGRGVPALSPGGRHQPHSLSSRPHLLRKRGHRYRHLARKNLVGCVQVQDVGARPAQDPPGGLGLVSRWLRRQHDPALRAGWSNRPPSRKRSGPLAAIVLIALGAIVAALAIRRRGPVSHRVRVAVLPLTALTASAALADITSASLIAYVICGVPAGEFAPWHVIISLTAIVSQLPAGVVVLDMGFWLVLTQLFGVPDVQAATTVVLYRTLGPGCTFTLGLLSFLRRCLHPKASGTAEPADDPRSSPLDSSTPGVLLQTPLPAPHSGILNPRRTAAAVMGPTPADRRLLSSRPKDGTPMHRCDNTVL